MTFTRRGSFGDGEICGPDPPVESHVLGFEPVLARVPCPAPYPFCGVDVQQYRDVRLYPREETLLIIDKRPGEGVSLLYLVSGR